MILSLQNISTETQAQSRLAVLRREICGTSRTRSPQVQSHWAYGPSLIPVFGGLTGKPGGRMPAASLFSSFPRACDQLDSQTAVNAKQEGSP